MLVESASSASRMPPDFKANLVVLKVHMKQKNVYDCVDNAFRSASSGESSDDSDVEEVFYI